MQESESYYYNHNGQTQGPIAVDVLKRQIQTGEIAPNDQICRVGDQVWIELSWSEFSDLIPPPPPPPLPPSMKSAPVRNEYTTNLAKISIGKNSPSAANLCYILAVITFIIVCFFPLPFLFFVLGCIMVPVWIIIGVALTYLANMANRSNFTQVENAPLSHPAPKRTGIPIWAIVLLIIAGMYLINILLVYIVL